ncbi:MAG TPA: hypothetical protein VLK65_14210 [Vicinamibacteria bacterium]|nr:hypothetical protein [Vicinamibacteria bacterium]
MIRLLLFSVLSTTSQGDPGQVQIPLEVYRELLEASRPSSRPAPTGFVLGTASVSLSVETGPSTGAEVRVELGIDVLENEWVLVPVLPVGTAVESVTVGGSPAQLLPAPHGLCWSTNRAGSYVMSLRYRVDAVGARGGFTMAVPLPQAASIRLDAVLPGGGLDVAVLPGTGVRTSESGGKTRVTASIPTGPGLQLSWRTPTESSYALSRASYTGDLADDSVTFRGELGIDVFSDETVTIPLFPKGVTLADLRVDDKPATIVVEDGRFAALVRGRGAHRISAVVRVGVSRDNGPPQATLDIPAVPVSSFELHFPGRKDVNVSPGGGVARRFARGTTVATVNVPLSRQVTFSWSEAVPEDVRAELRWNASLFHLFHAEEGVLFGRVVAQFEVSRGGTNVLELAVPADVQINRVTSASGAVADWKVESNVLRVFLDREVRGELVLAFELDRSLAGAAEAAGIEAPLFRALGPQRQKGMVALLSTRDLTLAPAGTPDETLTRVGENQLPPFVREGVTRTVAHTFKYVESPPSLTIVATAPEVAQGKFDARIDTLVSLGEASLSATSSVELNVKSGRLMALSLGLPAGVNVLGVTAPSLREHVVSEQDGEQRIDFDFTQEMDGDFRVEVTYEQVLGANETEIELPRLRVVGAEIEQGRIAVEALSAVEVRVLEVSGLTRLDARELPRQLVLRTVNPILMAFRYAQSEPPYRLELELTRHAVAEVQQATIDEARFRTLFTSDGLSVTTARFDVRNSQKQFLRLVLPPHSEVWSAAVDGRAEKPAVSGEDAVLVPIPSSSKSFPVEIIYATAGSRFGSLGRTGGTLARADILMTRVKWDVFLPPDYDYGAPSTNMKLVGAGDVVTAEQMKPGLDASTPHAPPTIEVPAVGLRYGFEKLYANQSEDEAWFRIAYATGSGALLGQALSLTGVFLVWLGATRYRNSLETAPRRRALALVGTGVVILAFVLTRFAVSPVLALLTAVLIGVWTNRKPLAEIMARARRSEPTVTQP